MKRVKGIFICFTGIDGSGKSSLARKLVIALRRRGIDCKYVYNRFQPVLTKPLIWIGRLLFLRQKDAFKNYDEYVSARRRLFKNQILSLIYQFLLIFDYIFQSTVKVKFPLMMHKNIICDRYVYDTVITDLAVDMGYSQQKIDKILKRLFIFLPKPDFSFLIDVPEEIAFSRKRDVPSIKYLKDRRNIYLNVGAKHKMIILDGSKSLIELQFEIEQKVLQ